MAFWGLEILPGKPMPLNLTRRLVVKQAALVVAKPAKKTEPCVLSVCAATTAAPEKACSRTESRAIRAYLQRQWARVASPHELSLPLSPSLPMPLLPPTPPPPGSPPGSHRTTAAASQVSVAEDEQRYVVCRLHEGVLEQCPMELPFSPGDEAQVPSALWRHFRDTSETLPRRRFRAPPMPTALLPSLRAASELHAATAALASAALLRHCRPPPLPSSPPPSSPPPPSRLAGAVAPQRHRPTLDS